MKSHKSFATSAAPGANKTIQRAPLPCNTGDDDELKPEFNSIGYYAALLGRLNNQIETVEDVYKKSFVAARN